MLATQSSTSSRKEAWEKYSILVTKKYNPFFKPIMSNVQGSLEAHKIGVRIGDTQILHDISMLLHPGEMCALIGPSGAGKSTLIKVLLGIREANMGYALLGGASVSDAVKVGYVPQEDALHRSLTISQSLHFAAELWLSHLSDTDKRTRIETITKQLGLDDRMDVRVKSLSGGQRKRVSVAMELLHEPQFVVLDEPTSGLDPGLEAKMMKIFAHVANKGRILMVSTHAMQSLNLCDALMILMKGHVVYFGTPSHAKTYFGVQTFAGIFEQLPSKKPIQWAQEWRTSSYRDEFFKRKPPIIAKQTSKENTDATNTTSISEASDQVSLSTDRERRLAELRDRRKK